MQDRSRMHVVSEQERMRRNSAMAEHLEMRLRDMEAWTEEECMRLKMTPPARKAAEAAWRRVVLSRRYLIVPKHTPVERRFLRMMIKLSVAEDPLLAERAKELARYLSADYPFEWLISPCTALARAEARILMLHEADSEFGETPMARQVAYVQHHWRQLGVKDVANLGECYAMASFLEQRRYFMCKDEAWRRELGLHRHALRRQVRGTAAAENAGGEVESGGQS